MYANDGARGVGGGGYNTTFKAKYILKGEFKVYRLFCQEGKFAWAEDVLDLYLKLHVLH